MEILINQGYHEILLKRKILEIVAKTIETAGRTCYRSEKGHITFETSLEFAKRMLKREHMSMLEFAVVPVKFFNVSRGFTHELVRHRHATYGQNSTRYIKDMKAGFVFPPHKDPNSVEVTFGERKWGINDILHFYDEVQNQLEAQGWAPEDKRQFYPIGISNEIVISANLREWEHIFKLRTSRFAHWEIRIVMIELLKEFQEIFPGLFDHIVIAGTDKNGHPYTVVKRRVSKILEDIRNMILAGPQEDNTKLLEGIINEYAETEEDKEVLEKYLKIS